MVSVKLNLSPLGKVKLALHAVQAILVFIALVVFIIFSTNDGSSGGAGTYYIILTILTIPALIYLTAVPMWQRSVKLANVFAIFAVDAVFAILWLAAWAAVVAWVRSGISSGASKAHISGGGNCTTFDKSYGSPGKCNLGNACVGVGVTLFIFFIPTAVISFLFIGKKRKNPDAPQPWLGEQTNKGGEYAPADDMEGGHGDAWSSEMQDADTGYGGAGAAHDDAPYDRPHSPGSEQGHNRYDAHHDDDEYELLQGAGARGHGPAGHEFGPSAGGQYSGAHPPRPSHPYSAGGYSVHPEDRLDDDTEYYGGGSSGQPHNAYGYSEQQEQRPDLELPPYPATPYGEHAAPAYDPMPYDRR